MTLRRGRTKTPSRKTKVRPDSLPRGNGGEPPTSVPDRRRSFTGFDRERATFQRLKPDLLASIEGKYVVIVGDEVVGPLESHEAAEQAGYERFGLGPLYVKRVLVEEPVVELTRLHHS